MKHIYRNQTKNFNAIAIPITYSTVKNGVINQTHILELFLSIQMVYNENFIAIYR